MPSLARAESNHLFGRDEPRRPLHSSSLRVPRNLPPPRRLPRVNVYLCIKQALFIRAMNMHCLVAVARCRVQTRRYHCLINHIQSQRPTLRAPFSSHSIPCVLRSPLLPSAIPLSRTRRGPAVSSHGALHRVSSRRVFYLSLPLPPCTPPIPADTPSTVSPTSRPQLTLIYVIFFGASTCYRVTRRILDQACPMCIRIHVRGNTRGIVARFAPSRSGERGERTRRKRRVTEPREWSFADTTRQYSKR